MATIDNAADWWETLANQWDNILGIIAHVMDTDHIAYQTPGDASSPPLTQTIMEDLVACKKTQTPESGHRLCRYLNGAWGLASDAYAWSVPGWGDFCDLCSEEWVFNEDAENEEDR